MSSLATALRGRGEECVLLDSLVSGVRQSEGRSLLLQGEPGIGKTALLDYLVASAADLTVVRSEPVALEMQMDYAALQQPDPLAAAFERLRQITTQDPSRRLGLASERVDRGVGTGCHQAAVSFSPDSESAAFSPNSFSAPNGRSDVAPANVSASRTTCACLEAPWARRRNDRDERD